MSNYIYWPRSQIAELPVIEHGVSAIEDAQAIVLLPLRQRHSSGYRLIDAVIIASDEGPVGRVSAGTDSIAVENLSFAGVDVLPVSGLVRFWFRNPIRMGLPLSVWTISQGPRL